VGKEYAVYAALLNKIGSSPEDGSGVKLLVVNNQTSGDMVTGSQPEEVFKDYKETLSSEFQAALKDYKAKNQKSERLVRSFNLNLDYLLVNRNEFQAFFKSKNLEESWKNFYKKYPNSPGYITLSRVGFDPSMTHACLYAETDCGSLCGDGSYILLTKEKGTWKVTKELSFWQS
ncbi:MAG: hypothetical protein ACJ741_20095, partial [Pyrinomonadaceae bacterium]